MRNIRQARVEQHLRHLCCFAGTGRRDENETIAGTECFNNLRMDPPDGKGRIHCKRAPTNWTVTQWMEVSGANICGGTTPRTSKPPLTLTFSPSGNCLAWSQCERTKRGL